MNTRRPGPRQPTQQQVAAAWGHVLHQVDQAAAHRDQPTSLRYAISAAAAVVDAVAESDRHELVMYLVRRYLDGQGRVAAAIDGFRDSVATDNASGVEEHSFTLAALLDGWYNP